MDLIIHFIEGYLSPLIVHALEIVGILIIAYGSVKSLWYFFKSGFDLSNSVVKITLGEALLLSLEFKLGAEIIKTVTIRELEELIILACVVLIRIVLTFVIHWEVDQANRDQDQRRIDARNNDN